MYFLNKVDLNDYFILLNRFFQFSNFCPKNHRFNKKKQKQKNKKQKQKQKRIKSKSKTKNKKTKPLTNQSVTEYRASVWCLRLSRKLCYNALWIITHFEIFFQSALNLGPSQRTLKKNKCLFQSALISAILTHFEKKVRK